MLSYNNKDSGGFKLFAKGLFALAAGSLALAYQGFDKLPEVINHPKLFAFYTQSIENGVIGALGLGFLGLIFTTWEIDSKSSPIETQKDLLGKALLGSIIIKNLTLALLAIPIVVLVYTTLLRTLELISNLAISHC